MPGFAAFGAAICDLLCQGRTRIGQVRRRRRRVRSRAGSSAARAAGPSTPARPPRKRGDFSGQRKTPEEWTEALWSSAFGDPVPEISFRDCGLDDAAAAAIAKGLVGLKDHLKRIDFGGNVGLHSEGWASMLRSLNFAAVREISFSGCALDDAAALAIGGGLAGLRDHLKRVDMGGNPDLHAEGWASMLSSLNFATVEEANFSHCSLDDAKAVEIRTQLAKMKKRLKKVDFSGNSDLQAQGWASILRPLECAALEEVSFRDCGLDDAKASEIRRSLGGMRERLKKVDFSGNPGLHAEGWAAMLRSLELAVLEEISLRDCRLDDQKAAGIAQGLGVMRGHLKRVDFSGNRDVNAEGWTLMLWSLEFAVVEEVSFRNCCLDDEKASGIGRGLSCMGEYLRRVDLGGNAGLSTQARASMLRSLESAAVEEVSLEGCGLDRESERGNGVLEGHSKGLDLGGPASLRAAAWASRVPAHDPPHAAVAA